MAVKNRRGSGGNKKTRQRHCAVDNLVVVNLQRATLPRSAKTLPRRAIEAAQVHYSGW